MADDPLIPCVHSWNTSKMICVHCGVLSKWQKDHVVAIKCDSCGTDATALIDGKRWCAKCKEARGKTEDPQ